MSVKKFLTQLFRDDRGQSTTEYILILAIVVMVVMKFKDKFAGDSGVLTRLIDQVGTKADQVMQ